jgi:cbb3-type cytochrome c oxidase subunit II
MDRLVAVLVFGGFACFALAFALSGLYPYLITDARQAETSIVEIAEDVSGHFKELEEQFPVAFARAYPDAENAKQDHELIGVAADAPEREASEELWSAAYAESLQRGRDIYVGEACWHCHSQYVRPVANEEQRFGRVQKPEDDNNALQRPVLWGTRRVGPDLTHAGGRRSNDWHVAHFWNPRDTSPDSIMPRYTWFFREGFQVRRKVDPQAAERTFGLDADRSYPLPGVYDTEAEAQEALARMRDELPESIADEGERFFVAPGRGLNEDGIAVVAYLQWLGTWTPPADEEQEVSR